MQLTIINGTLAASFVLLAVGSTACTRDQEVSTEMQARMSVEELALEEVCVDLRSQFAFRAQRLLESTPEPVIKGRPLSQWVAALGDAENKLLFEATLDDERIKPRHQCLKLIEILVAKNRGKFWTKLSLKG